MTTIDPTQNREQWPMTSAGTLPPRVPLRHEPLAKRVVATIAFLADASRRRRTGRRALWLVVVMLAAAGVGMLMYPLYTHFYAHNQQAKLVRQIDSYSNTPQSIQSYKTERLKIGAALTKIVIPRIGVDVVVVQGVSGNALRAGAGHYDDTALPGDFGNVAIAGHRTGFGEPFRHVDELRAGDMIILDTPIGKYTYQVIPGFDGHPNPWITDPKDFSVIQPTAQPSLTLTTCDPPHTSLNRLIVRAALVRTELKS